MKNNYKIYLLLLLLIISILSCDTKEPNNSPDESPRPVKFNINIINNSYLSVDVILRRVRIGATGLDNTSDIFRSVDDYHSFVANTSIKDDFLEYLPEGDPRNDTNNPNFELKLESDSSGDIVFHEHAHSSLESLLLRLNFSNKDERVLAGWPKYYYSKLKNVVLYGFNYECGNYDKKLWDYRIKENRIYFCYSIDSDDNSGNVKGYLSGTIYSIKITINSPDDIKMIVLPETGSNY